VGLAAPHTAVHFGLKGDMDAVPFVPLESLKNARDAALTGLSQLELALHTATLCENYEAMVNLCDAMAATSRALGALNAWAKGPNAPKPNPVAASE